MANSQFPTPVHVSPKTTNVGGAMPKRRLLIPFLLLLSLCSSSSSSDTLTPSQTLAVNQTLVSAGQKFELGFFSPSGANGNKLYLGIWYFNLPVKTIVWVANRDSPARSSSASLKLGSSGQIFIADQGSSAVIWSSNHSNAANPVLQLLGSGNLVVRDASNSSIYIWQSFDHPTDTLLPGQKFGWDKNTGLNRYLTSWRSTKDPSSGDYSFRLDRVGDLEAFLLKGGTQRLYRSGPWVGSIFSGMRGYQNFTFHDSPSEAYYIFNLDYLSNPRLTVDSTGNLNQFAWALEDWSSWSDPMDQCDSYMKCGPYGLCDADKAFICECPTGFGPRNLSAWALQDGSDGCERRTRLECGPDGFAVLRGMKLPESGAAAVDDGKTLDDCREACRKNCNCTAYASRETIDGGTFSGCVMWSGDLRDMRTGGVDGQDLYIRVAAADLGSDDSGTPKQATTGVGALIGFVILLFTVAVYFICRKRKHTLLSNSKLLSLRTTQGTHNDVDELELPLYDFEVVLVATNHFSNQNKLGEGGFGHVYKGVLKEEDVAIKRLSRHSGQGLEEFKNEVVLIAKLQHRNLVRLLGCCLQGEEKILIYEYLPNRSLDNIIFDKERCSLLDWHTRFNIIFGIARGLQYLHHDSRLRIIHRDLKSSNVLLDCDMNPKISDFGMARIFGGDETASTNTRRIVGTYGYMAPEYAMYGAFSIKSDVFSFGVLVLEIISGKANTRFYNSEDDLSLLAYAWRMWNEGRGRELVDPSIAESYSRMEVERCIQIGLLCVQERAEERPNMTSVVVSLSSEIGHLPQPQVPGFCSGRRPSAAPDSSFSPQNDIFTINQVTVSAIEGR